MAMNQVIDSWMGRRVWIIGASTGIGRATALHLHQLGARVAVSARNAAALNQLASEHPGLLAIPLDMTDAAAVATISSQLFTQWQGLDLVLIVAGTYNEMRADSINLAQVEQIIDVNLLGPYKVLAAVLPPLLQQARQADRSSPHYQAPGVGIVGSVAGYSGLPKALAYGPSKAAIINLCEVLYFDLRPLGINVYMINPGFVDTPLTAGNDFPMPDLMSADAAAKVLVQEMGEGKFDIHFPRRFTRVVKLMRLLPYRLYFYLLHKSTGL